MNRFFVSCCILMLFTIKAYVTLKVLESCDVAADKCPSNSTCTYRGCDGAICVCTGTMLPSRDQTYCVKGISLESPCDAGSVCGGGPFSTCADGTCGCEDGYILSIPQSLHTARCIPKALDSTIFVDYGQSCDNDKRVCSLDLHCVEGQCQCGNTSRPATPRELAALPYYLYLCRPKDYQLGVPVSQTTGFDCAVKVTPSVTPSTTLPSTTTQSTTASTTTRQTTAPTPSSVSSSTSSSTTSSSTSTSTTSSSTSPTTTATTTTPTTTETTTRTSTPSTSLSTTTTPTTTSTSTITIPTTTTSTTVTSTSTSTQKPTTTTTIPLTTTTKSSTTSSSTSTTTITPTPTARPTTFSPVTISTSTKSTTVITTTTPAKTVISTLSASVTPNDTTTSTTAPEIVNVGDNCMDKACPSNAECKPDSCSELRCICILGYATSPDGNTCWALSALGEICSPMRICQGPFTHCSDRGVCECDEEYERSDNGRWCRLKSSWFVEFPLVGEECSGTFFSDCYMDFEQSCSGGTCQCKAGLQEVSIKDRYAEFPDVVQCRNASYSNGRRDKEFCRNQSKTVRDSSIYSNAKSKIRRIQGAIIGGCLGFVALVGILIGVIVLLRFKRRGKRRAIRDTSSTTSTDRYSFRIPRPFAHFTGAKEYDSTQISYPNSLYEHEHGVNKPDLLNIDMVEHDTEHDTPESIDITTEAITSFRHTT